MARAQFGMIGLAVMGRSLAMNVADHGFSVAVWNLETDVMKKVVAESGGKLTGYETMKDFVAGLERPRKIMVMIKAGKPVDMVLAELVPLLDEGDIVIEGGNSWFRDTQEREARLTAKKMNFFGVGVSGGEEGARRGPSLMPGGKPEAYQLIKPILEAIAAKTESGPCVTHCGTDGAGHFVKMVHNGIEYADMQFIAEAYHLLRDLGGLGPTELADTFDQWNRGPLESFLVEITGKIFRVKDPKGGGFLIDKVLDQAGQKGTGKWTAQVALELGVAIPSIAASIDARVLSSMMAERVRAGEVLAGPTKAKVDLGKDALVQAVHDALYAAKVGCYAQGMALIGAAGREYGWQTDLKECARIWKGGCIIRARFLDTIMKAYERDPRLPSLLLDEEFRARIAEVQRPWRTVIALAQVHGIPVPAMSASLAYYDGYRTASLPQNLTQAQRDAFGAHTYQRTDDPQGPFVHTAWLGGGA
jgi:6-phosphogluconate dehydrogenase